MIGEDITQVLEPDTDEVMELTEEIREPKPTREQLDQMFYSCLRGYDRKNGRK